MNIKILAGILLLEIRMHVHIVYKTIRDRSKLFSYVTKLGTNTWINMILIIHVKFSILSIDAVF